MMKRYLIWLICLPMIFSYKEAIHYYPETIRGIVRNSKDKAPLENVFIYVVKGQEEAVSKKNGEFELETWQSLPVTVTFQLSGFQSKQVKVSAANQPVNIVLERGDDR